MTLITKATRLIEALAELPNAAMACVEMAREAEEWRKNYRVSESFDEACAGGPALFEMSQKLSEAKDEAYFWKKKHAEDNEGLSFQLGRNLEFAQQVSFRHGATEPHPTIRCIQIIDERATELETKLASAEENNRAIRAVSDDLEAKLAAVEAELNREREARRERVQRDEKAPPDARVLEWCEDDSVCVCRGSTVARMSTWRYLSPEDMP